MDLFLAARSTEAFRKVEKSWKEIDWYIYEAINCLPGTLQEEALARMKEIDSPVLPAFSKKKVDVQPEPWKLSLLKDDQLKVEGLFYQMYDSRDYDCYLDNYLRARYGRSSSGKCRRRRKGRVRSVSCLSPGRKAWMYAYIRRK